MQKQQDTQGNDQPDRKVFVKFLHTDLLAWNNGTSGSLQSLEEPATRKRGQVPLPSAMDDYLQSATTKFEKGKGEEFPLKGLHLGRRRMLVSRLDVI